MLEHHLHRDVAVSLVVHSLVVCVETCYYYTGRGVFMTLNNHVIRTCY